ncbi:MAG: hypothetical protein JO287_10585 [Pseudonocardiales bacterium]|nr:hypothetical protein [Pseudonocardiales bacterium]
MSTSCWVHLLSADEALTEGYRYRGIYIAVCGELIDASSSPSASRSDDCDREISYCPACLHTAREGIC